jgi:hypothetical protein
MEIDGAALAKMPPITEILDEIKVSKSDLIRAMRFSEDELIDKFLYTYDSLPLRDRDSVPLEALILKSGINPVHFLGSIHMAMREASIGRTKMIAMANLPDIMEKTVEFAQIAGGYRDREHLYTMTGILPTSKGVSIFQKFMNVSPTSDNGKDQVPIQDAEVIEGNPAEYTFPDSSRMQDKLAAVRQKQLESGDV